MDPLNQTMPQQANPSPIPTPAPVIGGNNIIPTNVSPIKQKKVGPIIVALVIVFVLVIVALYLFASRIDQQTIPADNTTASANTSSANNDQTAAATVPEVVTPVTNTNDDLQSLQNDLNTATKGIDSQTF